MDTTNIEHLMRLMSEHQIHKLEVSDGDLNIKLVRDSATEQAAISPPPAAPPTSQALTPPPPSDTTVISSPFVGTFYRSSSPDATPYVEVGDMVKKGDVLCIVEAMKLMNEIEADKSGKIVEILVENGKPVEFDQPLIVIE
ncbi:MAG: acetyl-CoA carboxylase biotin carboxyl carrier protein [Pseudomonadota bacterium]|nr:acetyl-CoA carboxylase biotin carboxyl carrier protein [Pseudomonadota bacterium]